MSKGEGKSKGKCLAYVAAFIIFQTAIILIFALTVMRIKSPKVRFDAIAVSNIGSTNTTTTPSFNMSLITRFAVKNPNFGQFKYDNTTLTILYGGMPVGEALIPKGRAKARKTRREDIVVDISSNGLPSNANLGADINAGALVLTSQAKLSGKVHLMKVIKKKKSGEMSCSMTVDLITRAVRDLKCE